MAYNQDTTEYMYCSARIRGAETHLADNEFIKALSELSTYEDVIGKITSDLNVEIISREDGSIDIEAMIESILIDAKKTVYEIVPEPSVLDFLFYGYDCNNLKAALKCKLRGLDPSSMFYSCASVEPQKSILAISKEKVGYPRHMEEAIAKAEEAYAKTQNPQLIDLILDRACYKDMTEKAENSRVPLFSELVKTKITLQNIIICIRLIKMKLGELGEKMLSDALLENSFFEEKFYIEAYNGGLDKLCEMLEYTNFGNFIKFAAESDFNYMQIERYADDLYMEVAKKAKMIPFGPEVAAGYLIACEQEVKNLRIILDAKRNNMPQERIKERLRVNYA